VDGVSEEHLGAREHGAGTDAGGGAPDGGHRAGASDAVGVLGVLGDVGVGHGREQESDGREGWSEGHDNGPSTLDAGCCDTGDLLLATAERDACP
jgi:hypothetical protein